jgi:hypothetical protein
MSSKVGHSLRPAVSGRLYGPAVRSILAAAQDVLDAHVMRSGDGRCLSCGRPGPCGQREAAADVFAELDRLPRRRPGATRPEMVNARRIQPRNLSRVVPVDALASVVAALRGTRNSEQGSDLALTPGRLDGAV